MGTPEFAVESLKTLVEQKYNVVAVVTQPDKPVGRHGSILRASEVKQYAQKYNIPVLQPVKMKNEEFLNQLKTYNPTLQVVVAFRMLPKEVWKLPKMGTFNVHAALLPQYRGAAPINWAIINGEKQTGVTTFFLDEDIDTGNIIKQKEFDIPENANAEYVYEGLKKLGAEICIDTIELVLKTDGNIKTIKQEYNKELKYAPKIFKDTCKINWKQKAINIHNFVRGLSPYPCAWTTIINKEGRAETLKIIETSTTNIKSTQYPGAIEVNNSCLLVNTPDNKIEIQELQLAGKKRMKTKDFLNGQRDIILAQ